MYYSVFEVFRIGVGPSSSHTVGPMTAGNTFLAELVAKRVMKDVKRVRARLYGSLALTGVGHATDFAVIAGLLGEVPEDIDPPVARERVAEVRASKKLQLGCGGPLIDFDPAEDLIFHKEKFLAEHPNGMLLESFDEDGASLYHNAYFSIGGGAVIDRASIKAEPRDNTEVELKPVRYPFGNAAELLEQCQRNNLSIPELIWQNELAYQDAEATRARLLKVWSVMQTSLDRGLSSTEEFLPGGLKVRRRAPKLYQKASEKNNEPGDFRAMDTVSAFAIAVNEENAAGGKVVTAPTNGSAGVIPAVLGYVTRMMHTDRDQVELEKYVTRFLLTAAGIGMLYKKNASISAAEMGCQGEIGVSCSMAAGGLAAVLGASNAQIENAAEIGMEHNLGMTCDPIGGLVQVPCIERNSMGAMKAINAARLALASDGEHLVSLDAVIETMRQTGQDLQSKYKETSTGGLAATVVYC